MEFRPCKPQELNDVIRLSVEIFKPNMKEQFRRLFSMDNIEHLMIAIDQGKVISEVNYYVADIKLPHATFKAGSIGSVGTDIKYRGQGIGTTLLRMCEKKMIEEGVSLAIISGHRGIYGRFGARDVGHFYQFVLHEGTTSPKKSIDMRPFETKDLDIMHALYENESVRYKRTRFEFEELFLGQTYPDSYCSYPVFLFMENDVAVAYAVLSVYHDGRPIKIKEYAGKRKPILDALPYFLQNYQKPSISIVFDRNDDLVSLLKDQPLHQITQQATLKIVNLKIFFENIMPYLNHSFPGVSILSGDVHEITLGIRDTSLTLSSDEALTMVMNGKTRRRNRTVLSFVKACFPLPMPWSHNMNYQ